MIKKTNFSTITAALAAIAAIAALGSIGAGIGLGQQQMALAQVDPGDIGGDEANVGDIGDTVRDILEDDNDNGGGEAVINVCDPNASQQLQRLCAGLIASLDVCNFIVGDEFDILRCRAP